MIINKGRVFTMKIKLLLIMIPAAAFTIVTVVGISELLRSGDDYYGYDLYNCAQVIELAELSQDEIVERFTNIDPITFVNLGSNWINFLEIDNCVVQAMELLYFEEDVLGEQDTVLVILVNDGANGESSTIRIPINVVVVDPDDERGIGFGRDPEEGNGIAQLPGLDSGDGNGSTADSGNIIGGPGTGGPNPDGSWPGVGGPGTGGPLPDGSWPGGGGPGTGGPNPDGSWPGLGGPGTGGPNPDGSWPGYTGDSDNSNNGPTAGPNRPGLGGGPGTNPGGSNAGGGGGSTGGGNMPGIGGPGTGGGGTAGGSPGLGGGPGTNPGGSNTGGGGSTGTGNMPGVGGGNNNNNQNCSVQSIRVSDAVPPRFEMQPEPGSFTVIDGPTGEEFDSFASWSAWRIHHQESTDFSGRIRFTSLLTGLSRYDVPYGTPPLVSTEVDPGRPAIYENREICN